VVDGGRVHCRALDGFARGRREAVGQWRPQTADNECFCGEGASERVTRVKSYDENAEEFAYILIQPDPSCPECATIMDWRSAHSGIVITNGAEIKLSDNPWGSRHLHMRDLRVTHLKNRVAQQPKERDRKERFHPVA
jgi:hypothetical protein